MFRAVPLPIIGISLTVHSALVYVTRFEVSLRAAVIKNLHETYQCRMCSRELLMMGKEVARNM